MLRDYAIIPDVFDEKCYSQLGICQYLLKEIKDEFLNAALVRSLYGGALNKYLDTNLQNWHPKAKELIHKLITQNRFYEFSSMGSSEPTTYEEWTDEAIAGHAKQPLTGGGIITSHTGNLHRAPSATVSSIEKLDSALWWQQRSATAQIKRMTSEYLASFRLIFDHANSLMFIDPHLDPAKHGYREFDQLLGAIRRKRPLPKIEIHRVCYYNSGPNRVIETNDAWENTFRRKLGPTLQAGGNSAEIFIWDDFHRRYLISDLIGIFLDNGFDVSNNPADILQMARLDRNNRDAVQSEFHPASNRHDLRHQFTVP